MNEDENADLNIDLTHLIDRAVKALFRECPTLITRLAGLTVAEEDIRVEDPNLNLPELRADHVFLLPESGERPQCAIYLEYQLRPDSALLSSWAAKWGGLSRQLDMPVILLVLYLQKGDRATFPARYGIEVGTFRTQLEFTTICLWEQTERIRNGELPELAPLLVLAEDNPTEETVREEKRLIQGACLAPQMEKELLGIALLVANRIFARTILEAIFAEDLKGMEDLGIIGDWMQKREAKGRAEGIAQGEAQGAAMEARKMVLRFMVSRFGTLPSALLERVEQADAEWCNELFNRSLTAASLAELTDLYINAPE